MSQAVWWASNPEQSYEYHWISSLFEGIPSHYPIVVVSNVREHRERFQTDYLDTDTPFFLIHLSDEFLDDDYMIYTTPQCKHVFRNYLHPGLASMPNVTHFAIGYKSCVGAAASQEARAARTASERPLAWSFSGYSMKSDRELLLRMFQAVTPYEVHRTGGFERNLLSDDAYVEQLASSKFVLCPVGNNSIDTFRLYEALESGCIPITIRRNINQPWVRYIANYWDALLGAMTQTTMPFVACTTWEEGFAAMKRLLENPEECEQTRAKCVAFWKHYKRTLRAHIQNILSQKEDRE